jgi:hypothetical protein
MSRGGLSRTACLVRVITRPLDSRTFCASNVYKSLLSSCHASFHAPFQVNHLPSPPCQHTLASPVQRLETNTCSSTCPTSPSCLWSWLSRVPNVLCHTCSAEARNCVVITPPPLRFWDQGQGQHILSTASASASASTSTSTYPRTMGVTRTTRVSGTGPQPARGQKVTIAYTGWLKDTSRPGSKGQE